MKDLVSVIIINWNSKGYIKKCADSIIAQTYKNIELIFIDNNSSDGSFEYFSREYLEYEFIKIHNEENNGYSGAANQGISVLKGEYVMIINPDIIMEPNFIEQLYLYANDDISIGAVTGKLLKYDFENDKKLNYIDSVGIDMYRSRKFKDRGQNELDDGQFNIVERVFGVCGAAPFYRKSALEEMKIENEYFDEDFFAYKEDIDISWRLNLAGYKCMYYPFAVAYHGRALGGSKGGIMNFIKHRKTQSELLRGISLRNQQLLLAKNENYEWSKRDRLPMAKRRIGFFCYMIIFERFSFKYMKEARELEDKMKKKKLIFTNSLKNEIQNINEIIRE